MIRILEGDCREVLRTLDADSVQTCVTSPPYWGLRDYGVAGQIGLEATPGDWATELVGVFREVRRVLRPDATLWLNVGDSYAQTTTRNRAGVGDGGERRERWIDNKFATAVDGLKPKDLIGLPWMLAFALRADGWYLRSEIIWVKPNPMPESVTDRPTKSHEQVFLLSKSPQYYYDAEVLRERAVANGEVRTFGGIKARKEYEPTDPQFRNGNEQWGRTITVNGRNARSVWTIASEPFPEAHFATFPTELARRCVVAGTSEKDTVLDPFGGAGTVGLVADRLGRHAILVEINQDYATMARRRIEADAGLFAAVQAV